jgi:hypothetical protein
MDAAQGITRVRTGGEYGTARLDFRQRESQSLEYRGRSSSVYAGFKLLEAAEIARHIADMRYWRRARE